MKDMMISPRKQMAMGEGMPSSKDMGMGADPYPDSDAVRHPDRDMDTGKSMGDGMRAHAGPSGGMGRGRMAGPGMDADHGPHSQPAGWRMKK